MFSTSLYPHDRWADGTHPQPLSNGMAAGKFSIDWFLLGINCESGRQAVSEFRIRPSGTEAA